MFYRQCSVPLAFETSEKQEFFLFCIWSFGCRNDRVNELGASFIAANGFGSCVLYYNLFSRYTYNCSLLVLFGENFKVFEMQTGKPCAAHNKTCVQIPCNQIFMTKLFNDLQLARNRIAGAVYVRNGTKWFFKWTWKRVWIFYSSAQFSPKLDEVRHM